MICNLWSSAGSSYMPSDTTTGIKGSDCFTALGASSGEQFRFATRTLVCIHNLCSKMKVVFRNLLTTPRDQLLQQLRVSIVQDRNGPHFVRALGRCMKVEMATDFFVVTKSYSINAGKRCAFIELSLSVIAMSASSREHHARSLIRMHGSKTDWQPSGNSFMIGGDSTKSGPQAGLRPDHRETWRS